MFKKLEFICILPSFKPQGINLSYPARSGPALPYRDYMTGLDWHSLYRNLGVLFFGPPLQTYQRIHGWSAPHEQRLKSHKICENYTYCGRYTTNTSTFRVPPMSWKLYSMAIWSNKRKYYMECELD